MHELHPQAEGDVWVVYCEQGNDNQHQQDQHDHSVGIDTKILEHVVVNIVLVQTEVVIRSSNISSVL